LSNREKILQIAKESLRHEINALTSLSEALDSGFVDCIQTILESKGRIVLTGIGKSALVAQKVTATLNSTGSPALFMHAADAVHGDMGMLQEGDIMICFSKSGESPEIRVLLPFVKNLGNKIVGVVSNKGSFLGKNADHILWTPIDREADPNNLAPTSSTTAQMAIGDALAVVLLELKGFTPKDFARYHPGGALGKQLTLTVKHICEGNPGPHIQRDAGVREVILEISSKRMGAAAVVDENNHILGIVTDGDLRRMMESYKDVGHLTAEKIMTPNPKLISKNAMAIEALNLMKEHSISQLLVEDENQYAGMIHLHDLIREGLAT